MTKIEPRLPKGMRDMEPADMIMRNKVLAVIRDVFERYGYQPLETPALEYWDILTGKYGQEAERLVYHLTDHGGRQLGLRYDLTVPLARFVASRKQLLKPFKRYQIQPVWRAEKPQKGRFREFLQCDVDAVGSASMLVDSELIALTVEVMDTLGFEQYEIRLNNRKILQGIVMTAGIPAEKTADVCQTLDKEAKIGWSDVRLELENKGYTSAQVDCLADIFSLKGNNETLLNGLHDKLQSQEIAREGIDELQQILVHLKSMDVVEEKVRIMPLLTRGLDYYTGPVYETFLTDRQFSSLGGGGRYNGLVGIFSEEEIPAAGTSFGLDRIAAIIQEMTNEHTIEPTTDILIALFSDELTNQAVRLAAQCRRAGFRCELFFDCLKLKKQFSYANQRNIPVVLLIGDLEAEQGTVQLKDMRSGDSHVLPQNKLIPELQQRFPLTSTTSPLNLTRPAHATQ